MRRFALVAGLGALAVVSFFVVRSSFLVVGTFSPNEERGTRNDERADFAAVRSSYTPSDARLLDRHGEVIHELRVDRQRRRLEWTPLERVSPALVDAVLVSEDRRFRAHGGVDFRALAAAAWTRVRGGPLRGASTITMQLAALLDPSLQRGDGARSLSQKWSQMRAAWEIERAWSKDEILEAYLNLVTFRGELQGVGAAAAVLFDKQPHGLTFDESLVLASLLRAPNADATTLQKRVARLADDPALSAPEPGTKNEQRGTAVWTAAAAAHTGPRVKQAAHVARQLLRPGEAVAVRSSLDARLQRFAAAALRRHLLALQGREVGDGAVLVADNATGEVLAYVGSSGDLSRAAEVDGVRARRQAGSSLKPFLYAAALEERLVTPASLLEDAPLEIQVGGGLYRPQNYDDDYRGLVSVRSALAASLNVPAVRLLQLVGVDVFAKRLRRLGFGLDRPADDYGPSLALGSADVTLWELVRAYRALANGGEWSELTLSTRFAVETRRVFSEPAAFLVGDILADRESRTLTFGLENPLVTRFWAAVKTGTSKDMRDNWCIGFSRRYTVGVWVGNFSGRPMHDVSGVSGAAPIWLEVLEWLQRDDADGRPSPPAGVEQQRVAFAPAAEPERLEWFIAGTSRQAATELASGEMPRIVSPAPDTIIALDPDIPPEHQRVRFESRGGGELVLDGASLGRSGRALWPPEPGRHRLSLVDGSGRVLHQVAFSVRGEEPRLPPPTHPW